MSEKETAVSLRDLELGPHDAPEGSVRALLLAELARNRDLSEFRHVYRVWENLRDAEAIVINEITRVLEKLGVTEVYAGDGVGFGARIFPHPKWVELEIGRFVVSAEEQIWEFFDDILVLANMILTQGDIPTLLQQTCNDVLTKSIIYTVRDAEIERRFGGVSRQSGVRVKEAEAVNDEVREEFAVIEQQRLSIVDLQTLLIAIENTRKDPNWDSCHEAVLVRYKSWAMGQLKRFEEIQVPAFRSDIAIWQTLLFELDRISRLAQLARDISASSILKRGNWKKCVIDNQMTGQIERFLKGLKGELEELIKAIGDFNHQVLARERLRSKLNELFIRIPAGAHARELQTTIADQLSSVTFKGYPISDARGKIISAIPVDVQDANFVVWPCIQAVVFDSSGDTLLCDEEGFPIVSCNTIVAKDSLVKIVPIAIRYPGRPFRSSRLL
jgi:hypothetical protein